MFPKLDMHVLSKVEVMVCMRVMVGLVHCF